MRATTRNPPFLENEPEGDNNDRHENHKEDEVEADDGGDNAVHLLRIRVHMSHSNI
jgi:hypothetical protein